MMDSSVREKDKRERTMNMFKIRQAHAFLLTAKKLLLEMPAQELLEVEGLLEVFRHTRCAVDAAQKLVVSNTKMMTIRIYNSTNFLEPDVCTVPRITDEIFLLLHEGKKTNAIKVYRETFMVSLAEAKAACEQGYETELNLRGLNRHPSYRIHEKAIYLD